MCIYIFKLQRRIVVVVFKWNEMKCFSLLLTCFIFRAFSFSFSTANLREIFWEPDKKQTIWCVWKIFPHSFHLILHCSIQSSCLRQHKQKKFLKGFCLFSMNIKLKLKYFFFFCLLYSSSLSCRLQEWLKKTVKKLSAKNQYQKIRWRKKNEEIL